MKTSVNRVVKKTHRGCGGEIVYREAINQHYDQAGYCLKCEMFPIAEEDIDFKHENVQTNLLSDFRRGDKKFRDLLTISEMFQKRKCPKCNSYSVSYKSKEKEWRCLKANCSYREKRTERGSGMVFPVIPECVHYKEDATCERARTGNRKYGCNEIWCKYKIDELETREEEKRE